MQGSGDDAAIVARPQGGRQDSPTGELLSIASLDSALCSEGVRPAFTHGAGSSKEAGAGDVKKPEAMPRDPSEPLGAPYVWGPARLGNAGIQTGPSLSLFVRGQPETQGSLRAMRGRLIDANQDQLARWRGFVTKEAGAAWGKPPITRAVRIRLAFYVMSKRRREPWMIDPETGLYFLATTGSKDVDKLTRAILDGLTVGKVYADDGLVVDVWARSYFASPPDTPPGVQLDLWEIS